MHMHTYMLYVYILCLCIHISMWIGHFVWLHHVCSQLKWFMFNCYFCVGVYKNMKVRLCVHMHVHAFIHTCVHTHMYMGIWSCSPLCSVLHPLLHLPPQTLHQVESPSTLFSPHHPSQDTASISPSRTGSTRHRLQCTGTLYIHALVHVVHVHVYTCTDIH